MGLADVPGLDDEFGKFLTINAMSTLCFYVDIWNDERQIRDVHANAGRDLQGAVCNVYRRRGQMTYSQLQ
jgi:hypothetical protein